MSRANLQVAGKANLYVASLTIEVADPLDSRERLKRLSEVTVDTGKRAGGVAGVTRRGSYVK